MTAGDKEMLRDCYGAVLLQAGEQKKRGTDIEKGQTLQTVRRNFEGWTKREVKKAKLARTLQSRVANMSDAKLKQMVSVNGLKNAPIRPEHVTNASCIFGPNTAALEGKKNCEKALTEGD